MPVVFLWLPLVAIAAHLFEEFVWPGGFPEWYRHYPPGRTAKVSTRFLVIVAIVGGIELIKLNLVAPATALQAVLLAAAYSWWSNWKHSRSIIA